MPKSSYHFKGYLSYGSTFKVFVLKVDVDFVKTLKTTLYMPESLNLLLSAIPGPYMRENGKEANKGRNEH